MSIPKTGAGGEDVGRPRAARRRTREKRRLASIGKQRRKLEAEPRRQGGTASAKAAGKGAAAKAKRTPNARRVNDITLAEARG